MDSKTISNKITLGIMAHVDAGKTTLAEAILFNTEVIRKIGRVDHQDTLLDNNEMERKRGITIFSKQAKFALGDYDVTLIDTPGHVDFAPEAERVLQVMDVAILVISGVDGVQAHTHTLWKLLSHYKIPVYIFVNKMDITARSRHILIKELQDNLSFGCQEWSEAIDYEELAGCSETLMEEYLESGELKECSINEAINARHIFPVFFGTALKNQGVKELLGGIQNSIIPKSYPDEFSARVFKITRDTNGNRLTHLKVLGGSLKVREEVKEEKVSQIRLYNGEKFDTKEVINAGEVAQVLGLETTVSGELLGAEGAQTASLLQPVMSYKLEFPRGTDIHHIFRQLNDISEELPELSIVWLEETNEIALQAMGEVQLEILKSIIEKRLGLTVSFGVGRIIYKETVSGISEGVGHFEPLRHYAEVHLKIEPGERGTGIQIETDVSEDELDKNWQRLIVTHLFEKRHRGVLTGAFLTDVKITVIAGRAHPKHTEGGDFRQATYRAVRHGLMRNVPVLLEPYFDFSLEIPAGLLGRAMSDITRLCGDIKTHEINMDKAIIYGRCPVSTMHGYAMEVAAYTKGEGVLSLSNGGYDVCHNADEVIEARGYNPEADTFNTPDSVFCAHGSGFVVNWSEVENYMHIEARLRADGSVKLSGTAGGSLRPINLDGSAVFEEPRSYAGAMALDSELAAIFNKTYSGSDYHSRGSNKSAGENTHIKHRVYNAEASEEKKKVDIKIKEPVPEYLLVDGYNIIFAWDELNEISKDNLNSARHRLIEMMCNYQGFTGVNLILVFDAYKVQGGVEKVEQYHNINIVYTKEAETADQYIEKTVKNLTKKYKVAVATSDGTEQIIIFGSGAERISAREFLARVQNAGKQIKDITGQVTRETKHTLGDLLPEIVTES